jgi:hypothetical protein
VSRRAIYLAALAMCLGADPLQAQERDRDDKREMLAERVLDRFAEESAARLHLEGAARERFQNVLRDFGERRHKLMREGAMTRRQLAEAVRNPNTTEADFRRALAQMDVLRTKEFDLWRAEQEALKPLLTARQQAEFAIMRAHFTERVANMRRGPDKRPPR